MPFEELFIGQSIMAAASWHSVTHNRRTVTYRIPAAVAHSYTAVYALVEIAICIEYSSAAAGFHDHRQIFFHSFMGFNGSATDVSTWSNNYGLNITFVGI